MKKCSYCGKQFADDLAVCPVDGQPPVGQEKAQTQPANQAAIGQCAFNLIVLSPFSSTGKYRVFVERNDLIFIYLEGGAHSIFAAVAPFLGSLGGLLPLALWLFGSHRTEAKRKRIEAAAPEDLLHESPKNFKLYMAEIRDAEIEGPMFFTSRGKAGRLVLSIRHGERMKCELETNGYMKTAILLLKPLLDSTLRVEGQWNEAEPRFDTKKKNLTR